MTKVVKNSGQTPKGTRYGGREKGTPNKATQDLHELAEKLGVNPFEILLHYAKGNHDALGLEERTMKQYGENVSYDLTISPELRQKSAKDACEYLYPKRKAIEHTGKDGEKLFPYEEYLKTLESN